MPKSAMGFAKFTLAVGASILLLEATGILNMGRTMVSGLWAKPAA